MSNLALTTQSIEATEVAEPVESPSDKVQRLLDSKPDFVKHLTQYLRVCAHLHDCLRPGSLTQRKADGYRWQRRNIEALMVKDGMEPEDLHYVRHYHHELVDQLYPDG